MSDPSDPRTVFAAFYDNEAIQSLAGASRWTISGVLGDLNENPEPGRNAPKKTRKAPIDVRHLMAGCTSYCRHPGSVRGAFAISSTCLMTLDELVEAMPRARNHAYYLQALTDGLMVIDIEPECPREVSRDLLALPGIEYAEQSMSGRGYHLLVPRPGNLHEFPNAAGKRVLRHEQGWYELLLEHWVTFTRTPVPSSDWPRGPGSTGDVEALYAELAAKAKPPTMAAGAAITTDTRPDIPADEHIIDETVRETRQRMKTLEDFFGDTSRWEFSVLGLLYSAMQTNLMLYSAATGHHYTGDERTWLLHDAAVRVLPSRPKHTETRLNQPFLLHRAASLVADRMAREESES